MANAALDSSIRSLKHLVDDLKGVESDSWFISKRNKADMAVFLLAGMAVSLAKTAGVLVDELDFRGIAD